VIRLLEENDDPSGFSCGSHRLNDFLRRHAVMNGVRGIGATYVRVDDACRILGYVTLVATSIWADELPAASREEAFPHFQLPALLVARLAVDTRYHGRGIGTELLRFALGQALLLCSWVGCIGVAVHAKPSAVSFYKSLGFLSDGEATPAAREEPVLMFLPIRYIAEALPARLDDAGGPPYSASGPAASTSGETCSAYCSKFSRNILATLAAVSS
jgi:GNAT superfamily N-acetyltransferase